MPRMLLSRLPLRGLFFRTVAVGVSGTLVSRTAPPEPLLMLLDHLGAGMVLLSLLGWSLPRFEVMLRLLRLRVLALGALRPLPRLLSLTAWLRRLGATLTALALLCGFLAHTVLREKV